MKMRKVISAFLVLICIFATFGLCTLGASAAEGARTIYATTNASAKQGSYGYLYVYLDDLTDLSALNVSVYYDTEKITVKSVTNRVSSVVNDLAKGDGQVNASYIFDGKGTAAKTNLFYIYYQVNNTAEIGDTYFDIVVNEAYNSALEGMDFTGSRCSLEITEKTVTKSCSISSSSEISTSVGEEFELSYRLSTYQIASGSMNIHYDTELFEVVSVTNGGFLTDKIADINTSLDGTIAISFVGTTYQSKYDVVKVRFKTLKNVTDTSDIKLVVTDLYDKKLNLYSCSGYTTKASIAFDESYTEDAPSMSVSSSYNAETGKVTATIKLEKDSMLGAGDFVLKFDTRYLTYVSAEKGFSPTFFNINDKDVDGGILKFSIISLYDITDEQIILTALFDAKHYCQDKTVDFEISGSGLVDSLVNSISLNFVNTSVIITAMEHNLVVDLAVAPTCTETGLSEGKHCLDCGLVTIVQEKIPALGHTEVIDVALEPNCTETGLTKGKHCSVCNKVLVAQHTVNALGHTEVVIPATPASCTESGLSEGRYCSACNEVLVEQLIVDPLGHRVLVEVSVLVDPIILTNDSNYPFVLDNGIYGSTNKTNNSDSYFTITATYNCTLTISYAVSSEQNYDKLIVSRNGSIIAEISGVVDWCTKTLNLVAGDIVTINYHKDVSAARYEDTGWLSFDCEQLAISEIVPAPAEEAQPTCTEAVVCHYCQAVVEEALGHDTVSHPARSATCTDIGWNAYETCLRCDYTTYVEIPANGHSYGDWVETTAPTCTENGEKAKECSVCHNVVTEVVDKLGHDEVTHNAQTATCEQIGWNAYVTCSRCDYTTYVEIPKLDHSMSEWTETTSPTCLEKGEERRDCSNCEHFETRELAALNHDRIEHEAKAPSCTEVGWDAYVSCSRCDYTTYVELPSKGGHTFGEWERIIDPTPDTAGMDQRTCSVCGNHENRDVAALGYLQVFINAVENLSENESAENTYSELYSALQLYSKLTDDEKQEANEEFLVLQAAINAYNSKAETANTELKNATEIAFVPISASFTFLAALWFLLKKKIWIK